MAKSSSKPPKPQSRSTRERLNRQLGSPAAHKPPGSLARRMEDWCLPRARLDPPSSGQDWPAANAKPACPLNEPSKLTAVTPAL